MQSVYWRSRNQALQTSVKSTRAEAVQVGAKPVPSNATELDGELERPFILPYLGHLQAYDSKSVVCRLWLNQIDNTLSGNAPQNVSYEDGNAMNSLEMLLKKLRDGKRGSSTRLKAALGQADIDRDGSLSYDDFVRTLKTRLGIVISGEEMKELTRNFDASGTGQIDYYMLTDVLTKTDPSSKDSYAIVQHRKRREDMMCKLRDAIRGKVHRVIAIFRQFDSRKNGQISVESLIDGLFEIGIKLNGEEVELIKTLLGSCKVQDSVLYERFVKQFDMPTRAHDSSLGVGMLPQTDSEDAEFIRRNKQTIYQKGNGEGSYDYINSGFLSKDQHKGKSIMQKLVENISLLESDFHRSLKCYTIDS